MRMKQPMNTFKKQTPYGVIALRHETKTTEIMKNKTVDVHFIVKEVETGGISKDAKTVLGHSTSKDKLKDTFTAEKNKLEKTNFSLEDIKDLKEKLRGE